MSCKVRIDIFGREFLAEELSIYSENEFYGAGAVWHHTVIEPGYVEHGFMNPNDRMHFTREGRRQDEREITASVAMAQGFYLGRSRRNPSDSAGW